MLDRLRGMFAFAIWCREDRELFCARDFFGIKPFYYTFQKGRDCEAAGDRACEAVPGCGACEKDQFIFASEVKSILEHPACRRELNEDALEQYLCFQFNPLDETFFKGIFKLPPAHCMTVRMDGSYDIERYWQPGFEVDDQRDFETTVDSIHETMRESVRFHNVADVEVGSFLSSGIDSSYMAACLFQENPDIRTFTVGFAEYEGDRDEVSWAKELADEMGFRNSSRHIGQEEYWECLPRVQWHMDEPSADPSSVALFKVDELASREVKAVLSGEGADEFFGGYRIYQVPFANARVAGVPKPLRRLAASAAGALGLRGEHYLRRSLMTPEEWYYTNANEVAFSREEASGLLKRPLGDARPQDLTAPVYEEVSDMDEISRMQYVDLHFWLVGDILLKTDKMSMAHSLESRVPFMDRKVYELSRSIPTRYKVDSTQTKIALRTAAERVIPHDWAQKEKLGFPVPIVNMLRQERYSQQVRAAFLSETARRYFETDRLIALLDEHLSGRDRSRRIWIVYMFLVWHKVFFENGRE